MNISILICSLFACYQLPSGFESWTHLGFAALVLNPSTFAYMSLVDHKWYLDSGCSRHMTRNKRCLNKLEKKNGGNVTFGDRFEVLARFPSMMML